AKRFLPLPKKPSLDYTPIGWSGPAHEILYEVDSGTWDTFLVVARPTGASPRTLDAETGDGVVTSPYSWSPDGKWVAYTFDYDEDPGVGVIDVARGKRTEVR